MQQRVDLSDDHVRGIVRWARETSLVCAVYVFGSRAKGLAAHDSDVDLAIVVDTVPGLTNKNSFDQRWLEWLIDLKERLGLKVDLLRLHPDNPKTTAAVAEAGVMLYRKGVSGLL